MTVTIYALCDPTTGEIRYVGKAVNPLQRYRSHMVDKRKSRKAHWIQSLRKTGKRPVMEALEIIHNSDDTDWQQSEWFFIEYFRFLGFRLTNLDRGGRNGKIPSAETREKISAIHKGRKKTPEQCAAISRSKTGKKREPFSAQWRNRIGAGGRGRKASAETRHNMRMANLGKTLTAECRAKISASKKGVSNGPRSQETKDKISAALRGKKLSKEHIEKIRIMNTGRIPTAEQRAKISAAMLGRKQTAEHIANAQAARATSISNRHEQ